MTLALFRMLLNRLNPKSDHHQVFPCDINAYQTPDVMRIKVPLTPKCFLNRNKTLFGVDYFGEKISAICLFLDFL